MVGIDPSDIGKHQKLIKTAQEDMSQIDVLVCGRCLGVFHFVEEFKDHKRYVCDKETQIRDGPDTKPKIWAFLLWKATQMGNKDNNNTGSTNSSMNNSSNSQHNSWALYQTWVKMEESIRETWIVAGKTIQSFAKMGHGGLQEMPVKITKTVVDNAAPTITPVVSIPMAGSNAVKKTPITQQKPIVASIKPPVIVKKTEDENDMSPIRSAIVKKPPLLPVQNKLMATSTPIQRNVNRKANRTVPNTNGEIEEEIVEKIVAKRFNPRRKMHEYLVKWEGCSHEHNTWEPQMHLDNVPQILDTFEKQLAKQKEQRAALQAKQQAATLAAAVKVVDLKKDVLKDPNKAEEAPKLNLSSPGSESGRLSRTSKSKAMDQVKQWCADEVSENATPIGGRTSPAAAVPSTLPILPTGGGGTGAYAALKRKLDDSDYDDSATPMLAEADLEEDLIPSHTVKRMKNGNTVSVKVETKNERAVESKIIKVNGNLKNASKDEPFSADVIITQDVNASGVVKKPGFNGTAVHTSSQKTEAHIRVISKGAAVANSGIVRMGSETAAAVTANEINGPIITNNSQATPSSPMAVQNTSSSTSVTSTTLNRQGNKVNTPTSIGNIQITQVQQSANARSSSPRLINSQTTIARTTTAQQHHHHQQPQQKLPQKSVQTNTRVLQSQPRTATIAQRTSMSPGNIQQTSPTSGKMIIPRGKPINAGNTMARNVTPEQKILQLSKSGDLKVTKKVMAKESPKQQALSRHQSQVQIQKVQQIAPPIRQVKHKQQQQHQQQQQQQQPTEMVTTTRQVATFSNEEHQSAALCPVTGKILGQMDSTDMQEQQQQQHHQLASLQSGVLQAQLLTTADQQQQQQHDQAEFQELDQTGSLLLSTGDQQLLTNEDGTPLLVTGEDGTVYQVAGKNAEGQTILVAQGADGEQQFAYVAAADGDDNNVLTLDNAVAEAVAQLSPEQQAEALAAAAAGESGQYILKHDEDTNTGDIVSMGEATELSSAQHGQLCIQTGSESGESQDQNIPAEVVQADLPSPGGTRRVVLLLQDGTFMITQMQDDEYKSLNIAS